MSGEVVPVHEQFIYDNVMPVISKLTDTNRELRIQVDQMDKKITMLEGLLAGEIPKKAQRAVTLKEALKDEGKITRRQAQTILGNVHHKIALDAMKEAAEQFNHLVCVKNSTGVWVLAVNQ